MREWKRTHACVDCSEREQVPVFYPWYVMDFDHLPGTKRITLGHSPEVRRLNLEELLQEMAKCDLVCANCHREREYRRRHHGHQSQTQGSLSRSA